MRYKFTRNKLLNSFLFLLLLSVGNLSAQELIVRGQVIDSETNEPLPGVSVYVKASSNGTSTDFEGNYALNISNEDAVIAFSFIGYTTKEIKYRGNTTINVSLSPDSKILEEAVVVGFSKQKKISVTGSVTAIKPSELKTPASSLSSSFAGRMPGIIAMQSSGEPGKDGSNFWVRGVSTFGGGSTNPLVFLDGVQINTSDLNSLDPSIIENFSILKDASATALYGARGANGVILIVTKTGIVSDKPQVSVRIEGSLKTPTRLPQYADAGTFMKMANEARHNSDPYRPIKYSEDKIAGTLEGRDPYIYPNVNWMDMIFKDFADHEYANVNIRGGGKTVQYFSSVSYTKDTGLIKVGDHNNDNIDFQRFNLQNNLTSDLSPTTKLQININANFETNNRPWLNTGDLYNLVLRSNPVNFPAYFPGDKGPDADHIKFGSKSAFGVLLGNPYAELQRGSVKERSSTLVALAKITQEIKFIEGLSADAMISVRQYSNEGYSTTYQPFFYQVDPSTVTENNGVYDYDLQSLAEGNEALNYGSFRNNESSSIFFQTSLQYNRTLGKHDIQSLLVYNHNDHRKNSQGTLINALPYRTQGVSGRLSYMYDSKYMIETNMGYTGSENFPTDKKYGFFPSISVGYAISNEQFFKDIFDDKIPMLKVRASYGLAGNDQIGSGRFPYVSEVNLNYGGLNYVFGQNYDNWNNGIVINKYPNEDITWEVAKKANIGIDIEMKNGLTISADVFKEHRSGILLRKTTVPTHLGIGGAIPYVNSGEMENKGIDAALNYNKSFGNDWIITAMGTFTFARNKVLKAEEAIGVTSNTTMVGRPANQMWGLIAENIYNSEEEIQNTPDQNFGLYTVGDLRYRNITDNEYVDWNDRVPLGDPGIPEITYGFGFSVQYKKFDVSAFFQGIGNRSFFIGRNMHPFSVETEANVMQFIADDYWSESNPDPYAAYPRITEDRNDNNRVQSSWWLRDGSFLRFKDAEFGYQVNKVLRVYVSGQNLMTFSNFKLWDPEINLCPDCPQIGSPDGAVYPPLKSYLIGAQFNF